MEPATTFREKGPSHTFPNTFSTSPPPVARGEKAICNFAKLCKLPNSASIKGPSSSSSFPALANSLQKLCNQSDIPTLHSSLQFIACRHGESGKIQTRPIYLPFCPHEKRRWACKFSAFPSPPPERQVLEKTKTKQKAAGKKERRGPLSTPRRSSEAKMKPSQDY